MSEERPGVGDRVRQRARHSLGVAAVDDVATQQELARLRTRMGELEAEVAECRELNVRLAQVLDMVEQIVLPAASQDTERITEALERYRSSL